MYSLNDVLVFIVVRVASSLPKLEVALCIHYWVFLTPCTLHILGKQYCVGGESTKYENAILCNLIISEIAEMHDNKATLWQTIITPWQKVQSFVYIALKLTQNYAHLSEWTEKIISWSVIKIIQKCMIWLLQNVQMYSPNLGLMVQWMGTLLRSTRNNLSFWYVETCMASYIYTV